MEQLNSYGVYVPSVDEAEADSDGIPSAQGRFVLSHERGCRKTVTRHPLDVRFRRFEPASVDSLAASCTRIESAEVDAPDAGCDAQEIKDR